MRTKPADSRSKLIQYDAREISGLVQQHAANFFAQAEDAAGTDRPQFVKDELDTFLDCGILAHGLDQAASADQPFSGQ